MLIPAYTKENMFIIEKLEKNIKTGIIGDAIS